MLCDDLLNKLCLVSRRPKMAKEIVSKSGAEVGRVGCPRIAHMLCFWDC